MQDFYACLAELREDKTRDREELTVRIEGRHYPTGPADKRCLSGSRGQGEFSGVRMYTA